VQDGRGWRLVGGPRPDGARQLVGLGRAGPSGGGLPVARGHRAPPLHPSLAARAPHPGGGQLGRALVRRPRTRRRTVTCRDLRDLPSPRHEQVKKGHAAGLSAVSGLRRAGARGTPCRPAVRRTNVGGGALPGEQMPPTGAVTRPAPAGRRRLPSMRRRRRPRPARAAWSPPSQTRSQRQRADGERRRAARPPWRPPPRQAVRSTTTRAG
jgi:hypothetical protein